jgi:hypothetical protein
MASRRSWVFLLVMPVFAIISGCLVNDVGEWLGQRLGAEGKESTMKYDTTLFLDYWPKNAFQTTI